MSSRQSPVPPAISELSADLSSGAPSVQRKQRKSRASTNSVDQQCSAPMASVDTHTSDHVASLDPGAAPTDPTAYPFPCPKVTELKIRTLIPPFMRNRR